MRILLATDGSRDAKAAVAFLEHLPLPERSRVRIVSVIAPRPAPADLPGLQPYHDAVAAEGRRVVDEARASLSVRAATETAVLEGAPRDEIVRDAREWGADLVVVGARGLGLVDTLLLGGVSLAVARQVDSAVLVVKGAGHRLEHVVVGLDGSDEALNAARFLASLPLEAGHSVRLVGVVEPIHFPTTAPALVRHHIAAAIHQMKEERRAALGKALDQAASLFEARGASVTRTTPHGHPAEVITAAAAEPRTDLVVVGARGLGGVRRLLLGSISENVLRDARCSVLIVKRSPVP
jgi:nucleotide-binding universal stress UspA family protein